MKTYRISGTNRRTGRFEIANVQGATPEQARRNQELASPCRRPRATDMAAAKRRWDLEEQQEMRRIERQHKEIWE